MLSQPRRFALVLTGLALFVLAAPANASDTMLDLVQELAAQPAPSSSTARPARTPRCRPGRTRADRGARASCQVKDHRAAGKAKAGKPHKAKKDRRRPGRPDRRSARATRSKLTAAARGSGRIDVIDMSGPVSYDDRPAIATKTGL
jgi:hypothetical protein